MKITFNDSVDFMDGIYACVQRGLTFSADYGTLTITLTGGF